MYQREVYKMEVGSEVETPLQTDNRVTVPSRVTDALAAFINQTNPDGHNYIETAEREQRRLAGRWLAWRRFRLDVPRTKISLYTGVTPQVLALLELGIGDEEAIPTLARERIASHLADDEYPGYFIAAIVDAALGRFIDFDEEVMQQVDHDLSISSNKEDK